MDEYEARISSQMAGHIREGGGMHSCSLHFYNNVINGLDDGSKEK